VADQPDINGSPVNWGILSTAVIGVDRVIPALQQSRYCRVRAIASRSLDKARQVARQLAIPHAYGSYEALFADPAVEAVYNPLPNHLHIEWSIKALRAGKHVLCEKPIALSAADVAPLLAVRDATGLIIEEAFMVRNHPQWTRVRELLNAGRIGTPHAVQVAYSHYTDDPADIRNQPAAGGGAIYDIGCYACTIARYIFDDEPRRVLALSERDPAFAIDRLSSAILEFPRGRHMNFVVSTQAARYQNLLILGSEGWIQVEVPFTHPPDYGCRIFVGANEFPGPLKKQTITLDPVNQYTLQGERFSRLIRGEKVRHWPLESAVANMRVIDALFASAQNGCWQDVLS
jgi:predicted dehydrogenase